MDARKKAAPLPVQRANPEPLDKNDPYYTADVLPPVARAALDEICGYATEPTTQFDVDCAEWSEYL